MPRAVGLDVGHRLLKLAELRGSAKSFKVHRLVVEALPEGTGEEAEAARAETVRRVFAEHRLGKDDVCVSFDAGSTVFRDLSVPFRDDDQIEKVVRYEAESHLHGRAIEDVVVNWVKTGETKEGSQVLVLAAPKTELAQRLALLRAAGIEPASVDLDATALYTACERAGVFAERPDVVVVEVGARTTNLVLVDGGSLRAIRSFLVGADSLATALQQDLALPPGEAERRAASPAGPDPDALLVPAAAASTSTRETGKSVAELERDVTTQRRDEFVKKLHREILRSITSSRATSTPTAVLLAGGGSLMPGLAPALAERMGVPVEPLGLLARLRVTAPTADPELADAVSPTAIGCALRLLGADPLGVELRRDEFAPTNTFEVVRGVLATAVTLLVLLFGLLTYAATERVESESARFKAAPNAIARKARSILEHVEKRYLIDYRGRTESQAKDEAKRVADQLPGDASFLQAVRSQLQRRYRELENNLGLSKDIPQIESALKVWVEVYAALASVPRERLGWFRVNKMQISQSSVQLTIEVQDPSVLDQVVPALSSSKYLAGRAKDPARPVKQGQFSVQQQTQRHTGTLTIDFRDDTR